MKTLLFLLLCAGAVVATAADETAPSPASEETAASKEDIADEAPQHATKERSVAAGFRNLKWGTSMQQVRDSEAHELLLEHEDSLGYADTIYGLSCFVFYDFLDGALYQGRYIFRDPADRNDFCAKDFTKISELLQEKYGEPYIGDWIWHNDLYQNDPNDRCLAVKLGDCEAVEYWEFDGMNIDHSLWGNGAELHHGITYYDQTRADEKDRRERETDKDKL